MGGGNTDLGQYWDTIKYKIEFRKSFHSLLWLPIEI